MLQNNRAV